MNSSLPDFLKQGEPARLFPVLSNTSKEGRTTSIVLACISKIDEFGKELLNSVGKKVGKTGRIETFTEVVFNNQNDSKSRPDGLLVLKTGKRTWSAIIESKVGGSELFEEQVERYRDLAKTNKIDCVITISNQFSTDPTSHPIRSVRKRRSSIPVFHWSWMNLLTVSDLLLSNASIKDEDQAILLNELRRFLSHESAGVKGFDRMPPEWADLNKSITAGARISPKSDIAQTVLEAWHQETKDLSLILSRQTETPVFEKLKRSHMISPGQRLKDEMIFLIENNELASTLILEDAAAPLEICAAISRRTIEVGMTLRAPENRVSISARLNWLFRQIRSDKTENLYIKLNWPGSSRSSIYSYDELVLDPKKPESDKKGLDLVSYHIFYSHRTAGRFAQLGNFISDIETFVPEFYVEIGQYLTAWQKPAPKVKDDKKSAEEVSIQAIADDADEEAL